MHRSRAPSLPARLRTRRSLGFKNRPALGVWTAPSARLNRFSRASFGPRVKTCPGGEESHRAGRAKIHERFRPPDRVTVRRQSGMNDPPITRPSLLVRLRDPGDERAWAEFLEIYGPLRPAPRAAQGAPAGGRRRPAQDVFRRRGRGDRPLGPRPGAGLVPGLAVPDRPEPDRQPARRAEAAPAGTGETDVQAFLEQPAGPGGEELGPVRGGISPAALRLGGRAGPRRVPRGRPGRPSGGPASRAEDPGDVAGALGMTVGAVYIAKSRVMARHRRAIEQVEGRFDRGQDH